MMKDTKHSGRRGFTIVELVIVIAVIAILAAVLIPTFSDVISRAKESSALQTARNAWKDVSFTYPSGYNGFISDTQVIGGWYYDYEDGVAKYDFDGQCTVTFNGEEFSVVELDAAKARIWNEIEASTVKFSNYLLGSEPYALILSYYDGIYSRGFSWITASGITESQLYIVQSNEGENADFSAAALITGTSDNSNPAYTSHKAWVSGLLPATVYSYKVGSASGWEYGVFRTESSSPSSITAIQLSDAQTKDPTKLAVWENTMAQAIETAGHGLDMILYNGDQYDSNMSGMDGEVDTSNIDRGIRNAIARETVSSYVGSIAYMPSAGNHEATNQSANVYVNNFTVDYGAKGEDGYSGQSTNGGCYSFDYGFAHFLVLNTNKVDADQTNWLTSDLAAAKNNSGIKWIIVMMHIGLYATGDHSNGSQVQNLITTLSPIFSEYHVDLVLQAHDHTYNKTLPYKWDAAGYTTSYNDSSVVNFTVSTVEYNGVEYDVDPQGTYYVTTGAAGHRYGANEKADGIWAEVNDETGNNIHPSKGFRNNTYKVEVGRITQSNSYEPYTYDNVTSDQKYNVGDYATGNVNAPMFGILDLTEETLTYSFYTVEGNDVKLFDTLNVKKTK